MLFNSYVYLLCFLPVMLLVYFRLGRRAKGRPSGWFSRRLKTQYSFYLAIRLHGLMERNIMPRPSASKCMQ